jgi:DNA-binding NarL/FixJ family response regulator
VVSPMRVLVADDHAPTRAEVVQALSGPDCVVVGEAATADEAVDLALSHEPDVALLDIHMPGHGVRAAAEIGIALPSTAVVMLTQSEAEEDLFDALRAGASGYLLKWQDRSELPDTLRGVLAGEAALPPRLVMRIIDEFRAPARRRFRRTSPEAARLSAREWEVMDLLATGATTDEVARRLFISRTTVRVHVSAVLRKLRVPDRQSALRLLEGRSGE